MMNHDRKLKIDKAELIEKLLENKKKHIEEYNKAVKAFKVEANKQLADAKKQLSDGNLKKVTLNLVVPVDRSADYDKTIEMFEWEIEQEVELTQSEFNEYVHDDNAEAKQASFSNSFYYSSSK